MKKELYHSVFTKVQIFQDKKSSYLPLMTKNKFFG